MRGEGGKAVVAEPLFVLSDGEKGRIHSGQRVPVPRRTADQHGNVSTVDYQYETTGFTAEVELREDSREMCRIETTISINEIVRTFEGVPVTGGSEFSTKAVVRSGGVYLLGEIHEESDSVGRDGGLVFGKDESQFDRVLQVWLRVYRIEGDADAWLPRRFSGEQPPFEYLPSVDPTDQPKDGQRLQDTLEIGQG